MAEAGGATTASGGSLSAEDTDEEGRFVHPSLYGKHLTVYFPLLAPVTCLIGKCQFKIKNKTWASKVQNFKRHMKQIHKFEPDSTTNWCSLCQCNIGARLLLMPVSGGVHILSHQRSNLIVNA